MLFLLSWGNHAPTFKTKEYTPNADVWSMERKPPRMKDVADKSKSHFGGTRLGSDMVRDIMGRTKLAPTKKASSPDETRVTTDKRNEPNAMPLRKVRQNLATSASPRATHQAGGATRALPTPTVLQATAEETDEPEADEPETDSADTPSEIDQAEAAALSLDMKHCLKTLVEKFERSHSLTRLEKDALALFVSTISPAATSYFDAYNPVLIPNKRELQKRLAIANSSCMHPDRSKIAMLTITNGLTPNIQEWLAHHMLMGISKIIFFDDSFPGSTVQKRFLKAIKPFQDVGFVELRRYDIPASTHWLYKQPMFYQNAIDEFRSQFDWMGHIDVDEFVTFKAKYQCLNELLAEYTDYGGLGIRWQMFSPLGVSVHNPNSLHFDQYKYIMDEMGT
ncbi:hypothetical protein HDU91_005015, partial [Kappamyces sp. JEL0680]